ncbi:MAG: PKD domain-containing protein [Lentimicrobiaceae bacterium]|nr:PKD domain-containing protein [Lentimicrobiaceae bacterium]
MRLNWFPGLRLTWMLLSCLPLWLTAQSFNAGNLPSSPGLIERQDHAGTSDEIPLFLLEKRLTINGIHDNPGLIWQSPLFDAAAVGLYFKDLLIPGSDSLLIYTSAQAAPTWVFTAREARGGPAVMPLQRGNTLILKYVRNAQTRIQPLIITEALALADKDVLSGIMGSGGVESTVACKVNVNCLPEGLAWQDEKKAVVRILLKKAGLLKLISGVLINNTRLDATPYILTSDYSVTGVTASDLLQTVFYFDYELPACDTTGLPAALKTLTGATEVASGGISCNLGSDFFLMRLNQYIPAAYQPYFMGWDRNPAPADSGVSIHFTGSLVKQIAMFDSLLEHGHFGGGIVNTHWKLRWKPTDNGFSTLGPGGEGAPLMNKQGRLVGTYTGGQASCSNPLGESFFGKFSVSWDQNGATPQTRLREWLDPLQTGQLQLDGMYPQAYPPQASLSYSDTSIRVGDTIWFYDQSSFLPSSWVWSFPGGVPETWSGRYPPPVIYFTPGVYDVGLTVTNAYGSDTLIQLSRIQVRPSHDTIRTWIDTMSLCADTVDLAVRFSNMYFTRAGSMTLRIDTSRLKYQGVSYMHARIQSANPQVYLSGDEIWITFNTIHDLHLGEDTLVVLTFLADTGSMPLVWVADRPWKCRYYGANGLEYPVDFRNAILHTIDCPSMEVYMQYEGSLYNLGLSWLDISISGQPGHRYGSDTSGLILTGPIWPGAMNIQGGSSLPWGGVNSTDALLILRHFVGLDTLEGLPLKAADTDGAGFINATDALMVAQRFAGWIPHFSASDWIFEDTVVQMVSGHHAFIIKGICRGDVNTSRAQSLQKSMGTLKDDPEAVLLRQSLSPMPD